MRESCATSRLPHRVRAGCGSGAQRPVASTTSGACESRSCRTIRADAAHRGTRAPAGSVALGEAGAGDLAVEEDVHAVLTAQVVEQERGDQGAGEPAGLRVGGAGEQENAPL